MCGRNGVAMASRTARNSAGSAPAITANSRIEPRRKSSAIKLCPAAAGWRSSTDLNRFERTSAGLGQIVAAGQCPEPDQGGRGHAVARRRRIVVHVFLPRDQGLMAIAGEEEPPLLRIGKLVDHDLGQLESRVNPARFAGRFIQSCQAVDQVGVVVEIGVELGLAVLVSVEQTAVGDVAFGRE